LHRGLSPQATPRRLLVLVLPLVLALALILAEGMLCGVDSPVYLLVMLMVGVALGDSRYFVDCLVGLLRVLFSVGLRLLLQLAELADATLLPRTGPGLPPLPGAATPAPGTDAQASPVPCRVRGMRVRRPDPFCPRDRFTIPP
jgi:hypothetical protein